jgi:hypothetical protein
MFVFTAMSGMGLRTNQLPFRTCVTHFETRTELKC